MGRPRKHFSDKPIEPDRKAEYISFVLFTAYPKVLREKEFGYKNDVDFAREYKLEPDTLANWRGRKQFWDDVAAQLRVWGKGQTADVVMGLLRKAVRDGGAAEAKLWFQFFEDFKEKNESTLLTNRETLQAIQANTRALLEQEKGKAKKK